MLASRAIISVRRVLGLMTQLLEPGDYFFFIHIRQHLGQLARRRFEFTEVGGPWMLPSRRDIDTKSFPAACDGNGGIPVVSDTE